MCIGNTPTGSDQISGPETRTVNRNQRRATDRRKFITTTGLVGSVILTGCLGGDDDGDDGQDDASDEPLDGTPTDDSEPERAYDFTAATWDSYWYSLWNLSTTIAMNGNGVIFPATEEQSEIFQDRFPAMLAAADQPGPPVKNPNLNMAPFTNGDPHFTQEPVLKGDDGRPDADTLQWDPARSSGTVSPSSIAWTHLKGVTWAKNFETHFEVLPDDLAAEFRSMVLATMAQVGTVFALVPEEGGGHLRLNKDDLLLASGMRPGDGIIEDMPQPHHHAAMLWFLGDLYSLASYGWWGYENPEPLIPPGEHPTTPQWDGSNHDQRISSRRVGQYAPRRRAVRGDGLARDTDNER